MFTRAKVTDSEPKMKSIAFSESSEYIEHKEKSKGMLVGTIIFLLLSAIFGYVHLG